MTISVTREETLKHGIEAVVTYRIRNDGSKVRKKANIKHDDVAGIPQTVEAVNTIVPLSEIPDSVVEEAKEEVVSNAKDAKEKKQEFLSNLNNE